MELGGEKTASGILHKLPCFAGSKKHREWDTLALKYACCIRTVFTMSYVLLEARNCSQWVTVMFKEEYVFWAMYIQPIWKGLYFSYLDTYLLCTNPWQTKEWPWPVELPRLRYRTNKCTAKTVWTCRQSWARLKADGIGDDSVAPAFECERTSNAVTPAGGGSSKIFICHEKKSDDRWMSHSIFIPTTPHYALISPNYNSPFTLSRGLRSSANDFWILIICVILNACIMQ